MPLPQENYYTVQDYYNIPEDAHVELIDGHFYNMSAPNRVHQDLLAELILIIRSYIKKNGGKCRAYPAPFSVQLQKDKDTVVEPDISVICDHDKLNERGCLGAPDWIIEIVSPSNTSHDYITKLSLYSVSGVREYWIVDPLTKRVHVYNFEQSNLLVNVYTFQDVVKSGIYENLCIDFSSLDLDI